jgi:hypothetical protein
VGHQKFEEIWGYKVEDLVDIYCKQVWSLLELAVPAWHGALTKNDEIDIERVQSACRIILDRKYISYRSALKSFSLNPLTERRNKLCLKFVKKG